MSKGFSQKLDEQMLSTDKSFNEVVNFWQDRKYIQDLKARNFNKEIFEKTINIISSKEKIKQRALELHNKAIKAIDSFLGNSGDVLVPFSGGHESTNIAILCINVPKKSRKIHLVTIINGYLLNPLNVKQQSYRISSKVSNKRKPKHSFYILNDLFMKYVLGGAQVDSIKLGFPSFCTACKILMEYSLSQLASTMGFRHIPLGYVEYQALQQWPEQTVTQRKVIERYIRQQFPQIHLGSPLYEIIQLPIDPWLLGIMLGLKPGEQKKEMSCGAKGTNPVSINDNKLSNFVFKRLKLIKNIPLGSLITEIPQDSIVLEHLDKVNKLKTEFLINPLISKNIFDGTNY